ncbi:MAG TPA: adenosine kinase, partial [Sphingomicrobium sp.]
MSKRALDIVAIGDAIVDVIATADDSFVEARGFEKGSMRLLSNDEARDLYAAIGPAREIGGGSAANSMAGAAALGLNAAFVGQVADDQLGAIFAHDMRALGVCFETAAIPGPPPTGVCLILVTPDAQRTMSTCPGASHELTPAALDAELIRSASITFLEGYLWGPERPRAAMLEAARIAQDADRTVAFTLSESLCIGDRRDGVLGMIEADLVDMLFGNEHEMRHLTGCGALSECI